MEIVNRDTEYRIYQINEIITHHVDDLFLMIVTGLDVSMFY